MGIFQILAGVVLGGIALLTFFSAQYVTGQTIGACIAICGAVLFAGGAITMELEKIREKIRKATAPK